MITFGSTAKHSTTQRRLAYLATRGACLQVAVAMQLCKLGRVEATSTMKPIRVLRHQHLEEASLLQCHKHHVGWRRNGLQCRGGLGLLGASHFLPTSSIPLFSKVRELGVFAAKTCCWIIVYLGSQLPHTRASLEHSVHPRSKVRDACRCGDAGTSEGHKVLGLADHASQALDFGLQHRWRVKVLLLGLL